MIAESARWGDIPTSPGPIPNTQAAWLNEANYIPAPTCRSGRAS